MKTVKTREISGVTYTQQDVLGVVALEFEQAFEELSDELFKHSVLRISDRERAQELVQETFFRAWRYVSKSKKKIDSYRSFLYRILNNLIVDEYRKVKTQSLDSMLEDEKTFSKLEGMLLNDENKEVEESMVRFDAHKATGALEELPDKYRSVLTLRYLKSMTLAEIADLIGETQNVVSVRIYRGLHKLRELLVEPVEIYQGIQNA